MTISKSVIFISWVCSCFVFSAQGADNFPLRNSLSRRYSGFLNDFNGKVQPANEVTEEEETELTETFIDFLYDIFLPIQRTVSRERKKGILKNEGNRTSLGYMAGTKEYDNSDDYYGEGVFYQSLLNNLLGLYGNKNGSNEMSSACINDTSKLIISLLSAEPWAIQFLDSTGKPGPALTKLRLNFVGDYDQCRAANAPAKNISDAKGRRWAGFKGNYCVVALNNIVRLPQIGVCFPSTCNSQEATSFLNKLVRMTSYKFSVVVDCRAAKTEVTGATIVAIFILTTVGVLLILGTSYDLFIMSREVPVTIDETNQNMKAHVSNFKDESAVNGEATPLLLPSKRKPFFLPGSSRTCAKVLVAFSLYSNGKKILNTYQAPGTLSVIHGIRFLSMSWVVLCHLFMRCLLSAENTFETAPEYLRRWTFLVISNGFVSVDTFFTLSGLLTSYITIKEMTRKNSWNINWPMFYFHRFWRLTPPYMISVVIALGLTQYFGKGPLWSNTQPSDKIACEKNWWTNLLYINNLVNSKEMCFGHSWYLANDMQFFILSPLMLIPFHINRFAGIFSCLGFLLITTITTGVLSSEKGWPTTMVSLDLQVLQSDWFSDYYIKPWCRIGPFIIGTLAGYVLAQTKGRPFRMPKIVVAIGWISTFACGLAVVYGLRDDVIGVDMSTTEVSALFNAVSRISWGACVSWVIIACSAGFGGPINALLSWSPFVFLGRLTYMSYLIHLSIMGVFFQNLGSVLYANDVLLVIIYLGLLVFVNMVAFVFVVSLESPMIGLEKAFIRNHD